MQAAAGIIVRKGHIAVCVCHAETTEQIQQMWIRVLVEDNKSRVDWLHATTGERYIDRMRVTARLVAGFKYRNFKFVPQKPCGPKAGDPATDDGEFFHDTAPADFVPEPPILTLMRGNLRCTAATNLSISARGLGIVAETCSSS